MAQGMCEKAFGLMDRRVRALEEFRDSFVVEEDDEPLFGFAEEALKKHDFEIILPYAEMLSDALNRYDVLEGAIRGRATIDALNRTRKLAF